MIDPTLPLELDDGTPMELVSAPSRAHVYVRAQGSASFSPWRNNQNADSYGYYYSIKTGIFGGGDALEFKVLRNCADEPVIEEDWS